MKRITLVPIAGLCNRMNAITSGIRYKQMNPETELKIYWWKTHDCCADFQDLFEPIPDFAIKKMRSLIKNRPATPRNLYIPKLFRRLFYGFELTPLHKAKDFDTSTKDKKNIYVACHNNWNNYGSISNDLGKIFIPTKELRSRIDEITKDWDNNVIGLHIRRTDNKLSIAKSPIKHFYDVINNEIEKNRDVRFYLATDENEVKDILINKYGKRIITINFTLKRNCVKGMKDAVIDLYCLALTQKIYGSCYSTYSIIASKLYNIELVV